MVASCDSQTGLAVQIRQPKCCLADLLSSIPPASLLELFQSLADFPVAARKENAGSPGPESEVTWDHLIMHPI
jgi:hypothetical protein